jgi:tetratricopeptide (TPR) repeat protein
MNTMAGFEAAKQFFLEGLHLLEANNFQAAEKQFARSLEIIPDRVSTLNNLSAVKIRLKKFTEAVDLSLKAVALEDKSPEAWSNLGIALSATKQHEDALQAYHRAINCNPAYARAWLNKAMTLLELKKHDEALQACDQALRLDSSQHEMLYSKSRILNELGRLDEARKIYAESLEMRVASSPVFIAERRATQKADVLVINQNPDLDASLKSFDNLQLYCLNYPSQLARLFHEDFHFSLLFERDAIRPSARKQIPQPDFVINNCANGELVLSEGHLSELIELFDSFGVPVVNHPAKAVQTTRDASAKLLNDIPGVLVPKTMRFSSVGKTCQQLVQEIEDQYDYPLIARTLASQDGQGMIKVDCRDALVEVLASGCPEKFFVTQFVDSRGEKEIYRKLRAAVVNDEIIIVRADYKDFWKVDGRKTDERVAFLLKHADLLDEEKRICADPEKELGRSAIRALRVIRDRIPLDVFGVDFEVDPGGKLIFYEANATMNLLTTAREEVPYPKQADDRLKLAFKHYFMSLAARR